MAVVALPGATLAQTPETLRSDLERQGFTIQADRMEYEAQRKLYVASGNVRIEQPGGRRLTADWVSFSEDTRLGVATGDVEIFYGEDTVRAQFAAVDFDTLIALVTDAELVASRTGFVVQGRVLERTGDETYRVEEGTFTTCRCPPGSKRRPFEIDSRHTDIRIGGYAVARHVVMRAFGFPVAYVPWLIFPVKTERQSGFLTPRFSGSDRGGSEVEIPFFWAARPDLNVLLRPAWLAERGFREAIELEYVFGEKGFGEAGAALLAEDRAVSRSDPDTRFSDDRFAYWLRHEHPLADGLRFGADWIQVSDNAYGLDFEDLPRDIQTLRTLESSAWASFGRRGLFGSVQARALDDLQSPNDLDRDDSLLHRLPDVRLAALPRSLGPLPLRGALDVRYTYFHQLEHPDNLSGNAPVRGQFFDTGIDGLFDAREPDAFGNFPGVDSSLDGSVGAPVPGGTEGNGLFEEGELLADRGNRVDLYPRVAVPTQLGPLEALAEVGFRETLYFPIEGDSETRELWTARLDTRTRLQRLFRLGGKLLRHVIEPALGLAFVSDQQQEDNPLFVPAGALRQERIEDADLRLRLRNPTDRVADDRVVLGAVTNRLFAAGEDGAPPRQVAELRLGTGYDFEEDRVRDLFVEAEVEPAEGLALEGQVGYDPKDDRLEEALATVQWTALRGHTVSASYRYLREIPRVFDRFLFSSDVFDEFDLDFDRVSQLSVTGTYVATRRLELLGGIHLSFEDSRAQSANLGLRLSSACACWELAVQARQTTRPSDTKLTVELKLAGLGGR
jgi:lipopolysaccharide assembly outer membrane protein LptD (OstA)